MKAFALTQPDQPAALTDIPDPALPPGGALVRIRFASVNGFDVFQVSGGIMAMIPHELPTVIGRDMSGVVEAVGAGRTDVAVGDEVLGFITSDPPLHGGTWGELIADGERLILARKPAGLSWEAAAAIPLAASTALDAVDAVDPKPGDTVLIMGDRRRRCVRDQFAAQRGARCWPPRGGGGRPCARWRGGRQLDAVRLRRHRPTAPRGLAGLVDAVAGPRRSCRSRRWSATAAAARPRRSAQRTSMRSPPAA